MVVGGASEEAAEEGIASDEDREEVPGCRFARLGSGGGGISWVSVSDTRWALARAGKAGGESSFLTVPSESSSSDGCGDDTSIVGASKSSTESICAVSAEAVSNVNQLVSASNTVIWVVQERIRVRDRGGKK